MLYEGATADFKPRERILHLIAAPLRQHFAGAAIVVQIHQEGELDAMPVFDQVLFPLTAFRSGILVPPNAVAIGGGTYHIGIAIAVDVEHEIGEILCGVAIVFDGSKAVLGPVRPFIAILTGEDIGMPIVVDVRDGTGFESAGVDHVDGERDLGGTRSSPCRKARDGGAYRSTFECAHRID